jgi:hypothetical protein
MMQFLQKVCRKELKIRPNCRRALRCTFDRKPIAEVDEIYARERPAIALPR